MGDWPAGTGSQVYQADRPVCLLVEPPGSAVQLSGILSACHPLLVATLKCAKVRRVTRHRIPGLVGIDSEEISGPTDPPRSESLVLQRRIAQYGVSPLCIRLRVSYSCILTAVRCQVQIGRENPAAR